MNANAPLLAFDDIKEKIRQSVKYGYVKRHGDGPAFVDQYLTVNKIVLSDVLVPVRDQLDYQMLVPAWLVYYDVSRIVDGKPYPDWNTSVFALNAVDGSVIDLEMRVHESQ
jgi:hypothetical protein